jgi:hypothetical protein
MRPVRIDDEDDAIKRKPWRGSEREGRSVAESDFLFGAEIAFVVVVIARLGAAVGAVVRKRDDPRR